ncbi:acyl-CoA dehydrogenase C-terminal domain-containing protein, partial [Psychrobacter urativorans]
KFYSDKAKLADYFVGRILPRIDAHAQMVKAGSDPMMNFDLEYFNVAAS